MVAVQHGYELVSQTNVIADVSISPDAQPAFFNLFVQVEQNGLKERALKDTAQFAPCGKVLSECTVNRMS
jgi:7,8-dihydro-6-hydroxymethylpterin-pyrophosphokinase